MKQAALGRLLRGTLRNGQVRVLMCDTTNMAELCRMTHEPSNVCAAALGRGISAAALLTASADDPDSTNLTMTIKGGGPAGALVVVAHGRRLKAYIDHPQVELPLKANGKLDVGGAVGSTGHITVVRDLGLRGYPALYLAGEKDVKYSKLAAGLHEEGIVRTRIAPKVGHNVHLEAPEVFAACVHSVATR